MLKMVLACATIVEGSGRSDIGTRLFESVKEAADRTLHSETIEVKSLPFLTLVVSQSDDFSSAEDIVAFLSAFSASFKDKCCDECTTACNQRY